MIDELPKSAQTIIHRYQNLPLGNKKVQCPYYINIKNLRMGLQVLIGKGTPEEIIQESLIYEKLRGVNFFKMSIEEIREFLVKRHIGIDCSGFVVHVLNSWLQNNNKKPIWRYLKYPRQNLYRWIARKLRPVENISAKLLTDDSNTDPVVNLNNVKPGDLIRSRGIKEGMYHVMVISKVKRNNGDVESFSYVQATKWYDDKHGVREGEVIIRYPRKSLRAQEWTDTYKGRNWTYEEISVDPKYSQVRRLKNVPLY
jgi:hypothetical protein